MIKTIHSTVIGQLRQDERLTSWWEGDKVPVPFFNSKRLKVTFNFSPDDDLDFIREADNALTNFLSKQASERLSISSLVYDNFIFFVHDVGYEGIDPLMRGIEDENEIWDFVYPASIHVKRRTYNDKDIYISIECNCEWEQEHGLQLVFRQGKKLPE